MKFQEIKKIAQGLGVPNTPKMKKLEIIRAIQAAEGNQQCFATNPQSCGQANCLWMNDCIAAVKQGR